MTSRPAGFRTRMRVSQSALQRYQELQSLQSIIDGKAYYFLSLVNYFEIRQSNRLNNGQRSIILYFYALKV